MQISGESVSGHVLDEDDIAAIIGTEWGDKLYDLGQVLEQHGLAIVRIESVGGTIHQVSCDLCDRWRDPTDLVYRGDERVCREHDSQI